MRRHVSSDKSYLQKLNQLARSCRLDDAGLASVIVCSALDSASFIHSMQKIYNSEGELWVVLDKSPEDPKRTIYRPEYAGYTKRKAPSIRDSKFLNFRRDKRFAVSLTNEHDKKLGLLALSVGCKRAELLAVILHYCLDTSEIIMKLQKLHNIYPHLWVTPATVDGVVSYMRIANH